jgi:hypothetical protein
VWSRTDGAEVARRLADAVRAELSAGTVRPEPTEFGFRVTFPLTATSGDDYDLTSVTASRSPT